MVELRGGHLVNFRPAEIEIEFQLSNGIVYDLKRSAKKRQKLEWQFIGRTKCEVGHNGLRWKRAF